MAAVRAAMREQGFWYANAQGGHASRAGFRSRSCKTRKSFAKSAIRGHPPQASALIWQPAAGPATIRGYPPRKAQEVAKEPGLPKEIASLSFEDALKELEAIVSNLERGQVKLDEAISAYERGALLKRHCEQKLAEAKMKVEKIVFSTDGAAGTQPADLN